MRRQLREAAKTAGDTLPGNECLGVMIRRWEKDSGGVSERYRMHYCKAFQIPLDEFGTAQVVTDYSSQLASITRHRPDPDTGAGAAHTAGVGRAAVVDHVESPQPRWDRSSIADEVLMTAHESNEYAQRAEGRDIGEASLEQLRNDVIRLSREFMTGEPLPLFFEMRRVRNLMYTGLDRRLWPRDQVELYFLLGSLNGLMGVTANCMGSPTAAEELSGPDSPTRWRSTTARSSGACAGSSPASRTGATSRGAASTWLAAGWSITPTARMPSTCTCR